MFASGYFLLITNIDNLMRADPRISVGLFVKVQLTKIIQFTRFNLDLAIINFFFVATVCDFMRALAWFDAWLFEEVIHTCIICRACSGSQVLAHLYFEVITPIFLIMRTFSWSCDGILVEIELTFFLQDAFLIIWSYLAHFHNRLVIAICWQVGAEVELCGWCFLELVLVEGAIMIADARFSIRVFLALNNNVPLTSMNDRMCTFPFNILWLLIKIECAVLL